MIVAVAIRHDVPLLSHDADMARIAEVTPLRLDHASHRPS
jgi:predicted nucleic acid-binding protein